MTVFVMTDKNVIIGGPPIIRKFIGQPLDNLRGWMQRQGGYKEFQYEQADDA